MADRPIIHFDNISHSYSEDPILHEVDFKIELGQAIGLLGPSGAGKTTLLNIALGALSPSTGAVRIVQESGEEQIVTGPGADRGVVYQRYTLFPHMSVIDNVCIGVMLRHPWWWRIKNWGRWKEMRKKYYEEAAELLGKFSLSHSIHKYPNELSGGMQQRVAIAQALFAKPRIIFLDEPFGALDESTRADMQDMLLTIYHDNQVTLAEGGTDVTTIVMVTHHIAEAFLVGDRVIALSQYWNWKEQGYEKAPGATVVFDKVAPIYRAGDDPHMHEFDGYIDEIKLAALNSETLQAPEDYIERL